MSTSWLPVGILTFAPDSSVYVQHGGGGGGFPVFWFPCPRCLATPCSAARECWLGYRDDIACLHQRDWKIWVSCANQCASHRQHVSAK